MRPALLIFLSPAVIVIVSSVLAAASSLLTFLRLDVVPLLVIVAASSLLKLLRRDLVPLLLRSPSSRTPATRRGCVVDDSLLADASRLTGVRL